MVCLMRLYALVLPCLLTACLSNEPRVERPAPGATASLGLDEAAVKTKSHAFFDAWDRGDIVEFDATASSAFETFSHERLVSKPMADDILRRRAELHTRPRTRTWKDETVILADMTAVFIGEAVEHLPAEGDGTATEQDGWHTLVWASDHGGWKVVHYQWQVHGEAPHP
jgi:hypothetical protein